MFSLIISMILAAGVSAFCFRVSAWHRKESDYWHAVAVAVSLKPALDLYYRPILYWARDNRPPPWKRVIGWLPPDQRMSQS